MAETIEEVKEQAKLVEAEAEKSALDLVTLDPTTIIFLARNPEGAVLQEFNELEGTLLQIRSLLPDDKPHKTAYETLRHLNDLGYIGFNVVALYMTLRNVRHQIASGESSIQPRDAEAIVREMRMIAELLRSAAEKLRSGKK